jgi:ATP adenylyltransferase
MAAARPYTPAMAERSHPGRPTEPHQPTLDAPWRQPYLDGVDKPSPGQGAGSGSFLLDAWLAPDLDESNHVVARAESGLVMLNRYPYAGGHLLVALGEARPRLVDYTLSQRAALWRLVDSAADLMERTLEPQGINIGVNQARAAGAGVPQHLHVHLVPRWGGDVNFMAAVGNIRVIPTSLELMAERYRRVWATRAGQV